MIEKETNQAGVASFDALQPGEYLLDAAGTGFEPYHIDRLTLQVRDRQTMRISLKLAAAASTTVDVSDRPTEGISTDAAQGIEMDQRYLQNLPANGRNAESLILMAPGITSTTGGGGGNFNANGLRENTNYYTLDGVSINRQTSGGPGGGFPGPGGPISGLPSGGGGSTEMISIDAMQEMKVQTSSFAPEFGRSPGAQVVMTSRSGSNALHGSLYDYERRDRFDANNWFANAGGYGKGRERQERPGGVLGGPIIRNKTFFFLSFERLKLESPQSIVADVPDAEARQSAAASLKPYLDAFPNPNGAELSNGAAEYRAVVSNRSKNGSASIRVDHTLEYTTLFARYSLTTSTSQSRGSMFSTPNVVSDQASRSQQATAGVTRVFSSGTLNDLRFNYSTMTARSASFMDGYGGAVPLTDSEVFPAGITSATGSFGLTIQGLAGYSFGGHTGNTQDQINVVDSFTRTGRKHHLKTGVDYRKQLQTTRRTPYSLNVSFNGISGNSESLLSGDTLNAIVSSSLEAVYPTYMNLSAYGQDTWQATDRTTITYGLRWDLNPAPTTRKGPVPFALSNDSIAGVTQNDPLYPTRWFNIAPRFGIAYLSDDTPGREMMLRAGVGMFYDTGYGGVQGAFSGAPYANVVTNSSIGFPLYPTYIVPPSLPPTRPYGQITTGSQDLTSPIVYQVNGTWEKNYGTNGTVSVGITANKGRNLMRTDIQPSFSSAYQILQEVGNGAASQYTGVQVQYRRRLASNFQAQLSYTWSHSLDSASNDFGGGGFASIFNSGQMGPSDYDIRQNVNFSGSLRLPSPQGILFTPLRHWYVDFVASARTGLPFDIQGVSSCASSGSSTDCSSVPSQGLFAMVRPDYVAGEAIWISDPNVPGGKRLNKAAFSIPSGFAQGDLGRNALRGFGYGQVDLSLRRTISFGERIQLNIALEGYNITNHPNFANPSPQEGSNMSSPDFGVMTQMLYQAFGGGVNSLYRSGGPRSMELSLRLQF